MFYLLAKSQRPCDFHRSSLCLIVADASVLAASNLESSLRLIAQEPPGDLLIKANQHNVGK